MRKKLSALGIGTEQKFQKRNRKGKQEQKGLLISTWSKNVKNGW